MLCLRCGEESARRSVLCAYCGTTLRYPCSNGGGATSTGMDEKTVAVLSYLLGWVTGLVFFFIERNKFVKFHAMQSILVFGSISVVMVLIMILQSIMRTGLLGMVSALLMIGMLILWVILMVKASQGETFKLPVVGDIAEKQLYVE